MSIDYYTKLTGLEVFYVAVSIARHGDLALQISVIRDYNILKLIFC